MEEVCELGGLEEVAREDNKPQHADGTYSAFQFLKKKGKEN